MAVTERKPAGVPFETWVERQIRLAQETGAFDDLPGHGKPIPDHGDDPDWWLRSYLDREGLSAEALLPESLQLRREIERLPAAVDAAHGEAEVRELVRALNVRIAEWIRLPSGPMLPIHTVDVGEMVERWRAGRPAVPGGGTPPPSPLATPPRTPRRGRTRTRLGAYLRRVLSR